MITSDPFAADMKHRELIGIQCLKQHELDGQVVDKIVATLAFPTDNQKYKNFLACSYKKQGFQSEDGKILFDNIKEFLMRFYSVNDLKVIDVCKANTGATDGDRAFNAVVCIIAQLKYLEAKNENEI